MINFYMYFWKVPADKFCGFFQQIDNSGNGSSHSLAQFQKEHFFQTQSREFLLMEIS